jgi:hypothetical protein
VDCSTGGFSLDALGLLKDLGGTFFACRTQRDAFLFGDGMYRAHDIGQQATGRSAVELPWKNRAVHDGGNANRCSGGNLPRRGRKQPVRRHFYYLRVDVG